MAVAAVMTFSKSGIDLYDRAMADHGDELLRQPGRTLHVCFETDDGYTVIDVWQSLEAFEESGGVLGDVTRDVRREAGVLETPTLALHPVHNLIL